MSDNISNDAIINSKLLIYDICDKITINNGAARLFAYNAILWLEYLIVNNSKIPLNITESNLELFSVMIVYLVSSQLRYKNYIQNININSYIKAKFSREEISIVHLKLEFLDLQDLINPKPILYALALLQKASLPDKEMSSVLNIMDTYTMMSMGLKDDKKKIYSACIAVAKYIIYGKKSARWNSDLEKIMGLKFQDFEPEFRTIYFIANKIHHIK